VGWVWIRWLHLLAMGVFVGGQIMLGAVIVPVLRAPERREHLRRIARRFAWTALVALAVLVGTGAAMASHFDEWSDGVLQVKLGLVGLVVLLVLAHIRLSERRELDGVILLVSLAIVWLGVTLAH
jgi:putative copper export protein